MGKKKPPFGGPRLTIASERRFWSSAAH